MPADRKTDLEVAVEKAQEGERFMETVFASIQDGISVLDTDFTILRVNPAMESWYSHAMPLVGKKCFFAYHGRSDPCEICPTRETLKTGEAAEDIVNLTGPGGQVTGTLDLFTFPMIDSATGGLTGVIEYVRDITERAAARQALVESERRLANIIDNTSAVVFVKDLLGRFVLVNRELERLFDRPRDSFVGKSNRDVFPHHMARAWDAAEQAVVQTGRPVKLEEVAQPAGGDRTYISVRFPLCDAAGEMYGICGVATDVTNLKRAEQELQAKDRAIRQAYVDVFGAATGNRLVLMSPEEIDLALGEPLAPARTVTEYSGLSGARANIGKAVRKKMPGIESFDEFIVGVCEAMTNAIKHAGEAKYQVFDAAGALQVAVSDPGPGIDFKTLPSAALEPGFSTQGTLGLGFTIMLEVSDRLLLSTQPGGTTVVLETSR